MALDGDLRVDIADLTRSWFWIPNIELHIVLITIFATFHQPPVCPLRQVQGEHARRSVGEAGIRHMK